MSWERSCLVDVELESMGRMAVCAFWWALRAREWRRLWQMHHKLDPRACKVGAGTPTGLRTEFKLYVLRSVPLSKQGYYTI